MKQERSFINALLLYRMNMKIEARYKINMQNQQLPKFYKCKWTKKIAYHNCIEEKPSVGTA